MARARFQGSDALSFVKRHGLWSSEQKEAATRLQAHRRRAKARSHPASRSPISTASCAARRWSPAKRCAALESGCTITTTMLAKDTSHRTVFPVFTAGGGFGMREMEGAADVLMVPDPLSFRVLPWVAATGWLLCDVYFADGRPVPFATRNLYEVGARRSSKARGYDFVAGLEVECHIFKLEDARMSPEDAGQPGQPPEVSLLSHGYQYLTEQRYDQMEPVLEIVRRDILALGPAAAVDRGRIRPEPVRIHLPAGNGPRARRQHGAVSQRREADLPPARLSRHLHVPAEASECGRVRLAPASIARLAQQRRQCFHGNEERRRGR